MISFRKFLFRPQSPPPEPRVMQFHTSSGISSYAAVDATPWTIAALTMEGEPYLYSAQGWRATNEERATLLGGTVALDPTFIKHMVAKQKISALGRAIWWLARVKEIAIQWVPGKNDIAFNFATTVAKARDKATYYTFNRAA